MVQRYGNETLDMLREQFAQTKVLYHQLEKEGADRDLLNSLAHTEQDLRVSIKVLETYINHNKISYKA